MEFNDSRVAVLPPTLNSPVGGGVVRTSIQFTEASHPPHFACRTANVPTSPVYAGVSVCSLHLCFRKLNPGTSYRGMPPGRKMHCWGKKSRGDEDGSFMSRLAAQNTTQNKRAAAVIMMATNTRTSVSNRVSKVEHLFRLSLDRNTLHKRW